MVTTAPIATSEVDIASGGATTLTSASFSVQTGDLLVVKSAVTGGGTINNPTATGLTFTSRATGPGASPKPKAQIFTAVCGSTTSLTVSQVFSNNQKVFVVEQWRDVALDATPSVIQASSTSTPNSTITTEDTDSVVTWIVTDNNNLTATAPTFRAGGGTAVDEFKEKYTSAWTVWTCYNHTTGAAGSKTIGWTAPSSIDGNVVGLELLQAAVTVTGTLDATLPALTSTNDATATVTGTTANTLPTLTSTADATATVSGTTTNTLPALTSTAAGTATVTGTTANTLPALTSTNDATATVTGTTSSTLPALTATAAGTATVTGTADATLPALLVEYIGDASVTGTTDATLPALIAELAAVVAPFIDVTVAVGPTRLRSFADADSTRPSWTIGLNRRSVEAGDSHLLGRLDIADTTVLEHVTAASHTRSSLDIDQDTRTDTDIGPTRRDRGDS